jgi:dTMP kinase
MSEGRLISFEGVDGAGKTTQIDMLENWLKLHHVSYVRTREPGGTQLGIRIKDLLLHPPDSQMTPLGETLLYQADREEHFTEVILPALEEGKLVITDRGFDASIAYQGYGRGVDVELIEYLSLLVMKGRIPDLTILLDLDPALISERVGHRGLNRLDIETPNFFQRVRDGYLTLAHNHPERIKVIDASLSPEEIHQKIVALVESLLES